MNNITTTASLAALLCAAPAVLVSCSPRTAQDSLNEEIATISEALDILEATTQENAADMLAKLEKLEARRKEMYTHRGTLSPDEVKKVYQDENTQQRMRELTTRLNEEIAPNFIPRLFQAGDAAGDMRKVSDIVLRYCEILPRQTSAPVRPSH